MQGVAIPDNVRTRLGLPLLLLHQMGTGTWEKGPTGAGRATAEKSHPVNAQATAAGSFAS